MSVDAKGNVRVHQLNLADRDLYMLLIDQSLIS
jgi:hypothetical protein